jgi:hypothetical protein
MKCAVLLFITLRGGLASIVVTPTVTATVGNGFIYVYDIHNVGDDPLLDISFTAAGLVTNVVQPDGWVGLAVPVGPDSVVTWVSTDVTFDIVDGASLFGFGFASSNPAGSVVFTALSESFLEDTAVTMGPVSTAHEPSALGLIMCAIVSVGIWRRRTRILTIR